MRSLYRTLGHHTARNIALVCLADAIVGASLGAIAVAAGLPWWVPVGLSVLVFAGASQFIFVGVIAAGGGVISAVLAGLLVNARHIPFGFAVGSLLRTWPERLLGAHLMTDEATAFALAEDDPARRRAVFLAGGALLFVVWNLGVAAGVLLGRSIDDIGAFGLDAAFPAILLALAIPLLRRPATARAATLGAVIALATTPFLPAGVPVLLALAAVPLARGGARPEAAR